MIQHHGPISGIAAFQERYIATAGYDNQIVLWDQRTREPLSRAYHDHLANQCAFSPDGTRLVTSSSDYTARLWQVPELRLLAVLGDQSDDVEMSVFHPDQPLVATASRDHKVRVYDFEGRLTHLFTGHTADVISVEWVRGARELVTSSDDGTVKRWSLETDAMTEDIDLGGIETDTVVISPDRTIYAGNDAGQIIILREGGKVVVPAHDAGVKRLVLSSERGLLVSLSYDRKMYLWRLDSDGLDKVAQTDLPADVWPRSCAFAAGTTLVLGTFGASYRTYDYGVGTWLDENIAVTEGVNAVCATGGQVLTVGDAGIVWAVTDGARTEVRRLGSLCNFLTPSAGLIVTGGQMGRIFDAGTGSLLHQHRSPLNCGATFDRDGVPYTIVGAYTGEGVLLRIHLDGTAEHAGDLRLHDNAVKGVVVDGHLIFSVCADTGAAWHHALTGELIKRIPGAHDKIANGCAALGNGWFASVSRDLLLRIWAPDFTAQAIATPHTHSIKCVAASAAGDHIATGAYDGLIAVYDRVREIWTTTRPTAAGISSLAYDTDRDIFLASSYDGKVYEVARETAASAP
ncbi:WD40 repeat domain-containing protein [Streptosporangium sp. NPDC000396]|uniref:WD40 repeat domain-containing protein n=1 Tax=Streptosporangium sp. NPDC000396 TaxID=3366185 RepID=UPI0036931023